MKLNIVCETSNKGLFLSDSFTYFDADATDVGPLTARVRQQDVLWFQVTVDDSFAAEDAHSRSNLLEENPQGVFSQSPFC